MMRLPTEKYRFEMYKRIDNSFEYRTSAIVFYASIISTHDAQQKQLAKGLLTGQTRLVIRTTKDINFKPQDKIIFDNEEYLVENVGYELDNSMYLLSNRGKKERTPKVVTLC